MPDDGSSFRLGMTGMGDFSRISQIERAEAQAQQLAKSGNLRNGSTLAKAEGAEQSSQRTEKAATQFEALLLQQMVQSMWSSIPSEGTLTGSREEELYRDMLSETIATQMAETQSLGIKDIVMKDMRRAEKKDVTK